MLTDWQVFGLFKDKYVHLGGDEVSLDCWNTNPFLQRFMRRNNLFDVKDLLNVYTKKLVDIVEDIGTNREQVSLLTYSIFGSCSQPSDVSACSGPAKV